MPKIKKGRIGIRIDMTPMVDVAFLLLTFFMLTTQFRPPEEVSIILPSSHSPIKLPESDVAIVTVSKEGDLYMGVDQQNLRVRLFGEDAKLKSSVRVDLPELEKLLINARIANPKLRFVIKGDRDAEYGPVMDVMNMFEKTKITRFNLVTDLERGE
jgi:biopolymer transport protein ExbD